MHICLKTLVSIQPRTSPLNFSACRDVCRVRHQPGGSVRGEQANLTGLVLGCIEAKFCKNICVGKLSPRSTQCTPLHRSQFSKFSSKIAEHFANFFVKFCQIFARFWLIFPDFYTDVRKAENEDGKRK